MSKLLLAAKHVDKWYGERTGRHFPTDALPVVSHLLEGHVIAVFSTTHPQTGFPARAILTLNGKTIDLNRIIPVPENAPSLYDSP